MAPVTKKVETAQGFPQETPKVEMEYGKRADQSVQNSEAGKNVAQVLRDKRVMAKVEQNGGDIDKLRKEFAKIETAKELNNFIKKLQNYGVVDKRLDDALAWTEKQIELENSKQKGKPPSPEKVARGSQDRQDKVKATQQIAEREKEIGDNYFMKPA